MFSRRAVVLITLVAGALQIAGCDNKGVAVLAMSLAGREKQSPGRTFAAGEHIRLSGNDSAVIALTPGIFVKLTDGADVLLEELRLRKRRHAVGNEMKSRLARVSLGAGSMCVAVWEDENLTRAELFIETSAGQISAEAGSLLLLAVSPDGLRVTCVRGPAGRRKGVVTEQLEPGWTYELNGDGGARKRTVEAAYDAQGQADVEALLDADEQIRDEVARARAKPFPWRRESFATVTRQTLPKIVIAWP